MCFIQHYYAFICAHFHILPQLKKNLFQNVVFINKKFIGHLLIYNFIYSIIGYQ